MWSLEAAAVVCTTTPRHPQALVAVQHLLNTGAASRKAARSRRVCNDGAWSCLSVPKNFGFKRALSQMGSRSQVLSERITLFAVTKEKIPLQSEEANQITNREEPAQFLTLVWKMHSTNRITSSQSPRIYVPLVSNIGTSLLYILSADFSTLCFIRLLQCLSTSVCSWSNCSQHIKTAALRRCQRHGQLLYLCAQRGCCWRMDTLQKDTADGLCSSGCVDYMEA